MLKKNKNFSEGDLALLNSTNSVAVKSALEAIKNPVAACAEVHKCIEQLNISIREKAANPDTERKFSHFSKYKFREKALHWWFSDISYLPLSGLFLSREIFHSVSWDYVVADFITSCTQ